MYSQLKTEVTVLVTSFLFLTGLLVKGSTANNCLQEFPYKHLFDLSLTYSPRNVAFVSKYQKR